MNSPSRKRRSSRKRRGHRPIVIKDPTKCYNCKKVGLDPSVQYCPHCGFPQGKDNEEKRSFLLAQRKKRSALDELENNIARASNFLYFLGVINLLFIYYSPTAWSILNSSIIGVIYLVLGYLTPKHPFPTLLTALVIYVSLSVLVFIFNPLGLLIQIAAKAIVIGALSFGLNSAIKAEKLQRELEGAKAH